ncbi:hypothetical protein EJ04DRAFT_567588 [Polyplosphaeria fusca]|uniref:Uncharacterized protein n=1 Tax=Polyplosphaeria fusca TaxID=682080 RepID=A0A9P4QNA8_9PLEO|nr:hypothetical protein EJ04DRAFT_567588 [Polyplosphaeria fusca]
MSSLDGLNLPTAKLTGDLHEFLDSAVVPLLLVTFNSTNHSDVDNMKWDAVQLAYRLAFNPLRNDDAAPLKQLFRMWVTLTTYDLILPALNAPRRLYDFLEQVMSQAATKMLSYLVQLLQLGTEKSRFLIHLMLFILSLCTFSGVSAPEYISPPLTLRLGSLHDTEAVHFHSIMHESSGSFFRHIADSSKVLL